MDRSRSAIDVGFMARGLDANFAPRVQAINGMGKYDGIDGAEAARAEGAGAVSRRSRRARRFILMDELDTLGVDSPVLV